MYDSPLPTLPPLHAPTVVPINYLLRRTPFRGSLPQDTSQQPSETEVVKALRAHANHAGETGRRCVIVHRVGGHALNGMT